MTTETGIQILSIVAGGSANKGQDIAFKMRVTDGKQEIDQMLFLSQDMVPVFISHLMTYAGLARDTRVANNPAEEADNTLSDAHTLVLNNVFHGVSATDKTRGILILQSDVGQARLLNSYYAADKLVLTKLREACNQALEALNNPAKAPSNKKMN
jgi:hypothetical protein